MKKLLPYVGLTIVLSVIFHFVWLWYFPYYSTTETVRNIFELKSEWKVNSLGYSDLRYAGKDVVVRDNPDTKTSFAVYDVSSKPLRVHCVIPVTDNYWSVSLFAWNTDNFYVVNDRTSKAREFDFVIVKPGSKYRGSDNEQVVVTPTLKGVMIVRMIVTDRNDKEELARISDVQKKTYIESIAAAGY